MTLDGAQLRAGWQRINVHENDADDWEFALPQGHTIEIGPDGSKGYSLVYVVRDDSGTVEEISLGHQPNRDSAMTAAEAVPVCVTCGLPIQETTERWTGWDHLQWDDQPHDVSPRRM